MNLLVLRGQSVQSGSEVWARVSAGNLAGAAPGDLLAEAPTGTRLIVRSGWVAIDPSEDATPTIPWAAPARGKLDQAIEAVLPLLAGRGQTLLLTPRASDLLSDIPSTLTFFRRWSGQGLRLFLEPAALLTPSMLGRVEEHLERTGEALGSLEATAAVLVTNVRVTGDTLTRSPLHQGEIDPAMLGAFARAAAGAGKPVVLLDDDLPAQLRVIGEA